VNLCRDLVRSEPDLIIICDANNRVSPLNFSNFAPNPAPRGLYFFSLNAQKTSLRFGISPNQIRFGTNQVSGVSPPENDVLGDLKILGNFYIYRLPRHSLTAH